MSKVSKSEFHRALAIVVRGAEQDMEALAIAAGSRPPGVQYPQDRYVVIVRRILRRRQR